MRLFVTHEPLGDMVAGQTVNFMISSGADFTVQGEIVPEPGTLTLVGAGLATLGAAARCRRTRRG